MPRCLLKHCYYHVTSNYLKDKHKPINLFSFPSNKEMRKKWLLACGVKEEEIYVGFPRICLLHFTEDSIDWEKSPFRMHLKKNAVPTMKLTKVENTSECSEMTYSCGQDYRSLISNDGCHDKSSSSHQSSILSTSSPKSINHQELLIKEENTSESSEMSNSCEHYSVLSSSTGFHEDNSNHSVRIQSKSPSILEIHQSKSVPSSPNSINHPELHIKDENDSESSEMTRSIPSSSTEIVGNSSNHFVGIQVKSPSSLGIQQSKIRPCVPNSMNHPELLMKEGNTSENSKMITLSYKHYLVPSTSTGFHGNNSNYLVGIQLKPLPSLGIHQTQTPLSSPESRNQEDTSPRMIKMKSRLKKANKTIKRLRVSLQYYKKKAATLLAMNLNLKNQLK